MPGSASAMRLLSMMGFAALAACTVVPPSAPPLPPPTPQQSAPQPPPPPPSPVAVMPEKLWDVAPLSQGDWQYSQDRMGTTAAFGLPRYAQLTLRCEPAVRRITIEAMGAVGNPMTVRTSSGDFTWPTVALHYENQPTETSAATSVTLPASDRAFDAIAFSRGRIAVEVPGMTRLILPVWAEVSRVIEDCRG